MSFSFMAAVVAAAVSLTPATAQATAEAENYQAYDGDLSAVSCEYNEESGYYDYSFSDGASFACTGMISEELNVCSVFWIATEDEDVQIKITMDGEPFAYSPTLLIDGKGFYVVTVTHELRDGSGEQSVDFGVNVTEDREYSIGDTSERTSVEGRIPLTPDGGEFSAEITENVNIGSNVADGETVGYTVKLDIPDSVSCYAVKDGGSFAVPSNGVISEDGFYAFTFAYVDSELNSWEYAMDFAICREPTSSLGIYLPPRGYKIVSAELDGNPVEIPAEGSFLNLSEDGEYAVSYTNGAQTRYSSVTRDTVPPVLYFNGTSDIVFYDDVEITSDSECTITVSQNGQNLGEKTRLSGNGFFTVTATDAAGNTTSERIEIKAVSAINPLDFVIIGGALAIGLAGYFLWLKSRKISVR